MGLSEDPTRGRFTLVGALAGLVKSGSDPRLVATLHTSAGDLECELWPTKAPITVANFVGLARGVRLWRDPRLTQWVESPAYDGAPFHRVIKGFMIQGGDPTGTGRGEPGYVIPDEIWPGSSHDRRGLLCMANRGPGTNGMQFFITDGKAEHLDGDYTIFGVCDSHDVLDTIANSDVKGDRATSPFVIQRVTVEWKP
jgi:peptidyl-prolyl cis-trans isomerase A (cyclophilin A)